MREAFIRFDGREHELLRQGEAMAHIGRQSRPLRYLLIALLYFLLQMNSSVDAFAFEAWLYSSLCVLWSLP